MWMIFKKIGMLLLVGAATACGGGGGGGGGGGAANPAAITAANAETIAAYAINAAALSVDIGDLGGGILSSGGGPQLAGKPQAIGVGLDKTAKLIRPVFQVVIPPTTLDCLVSGSVTISGDVADVSTLTPGDTITANFNNCDDGDGIVIDGRLTIDVESVSGDLILDDVLGISGQFELGLSVTVNELAVVEAGDRVTADGAFSLLLDTLNEPVVVSTVSGSRLTFSGGGERLTLENFSTESTADLGVFPEAYSVTSSGRVSGSAFQGYVDYSTPTAFTGSGDEAPFAGVMRVLGADNASIVLTALDSATVLLEMDYDGDGAVDETRTVTWDVLTG